MTNRFLNTLAFIFILGSVFGQKKLHISLTEANSLKKISFVKVVTDDTSFVTDISGDFDITKPQPNTTISFTCYPYTPQKLKIKPNNDSLLVTFSRQKSRNLYESDNNANEIIRRITANKKRNNPISYAPFHYTTYNKFFIDTDQISEAKGFVDKFIHSFSIKLKDFEGDHFILLTESTTERRYIDYIHEDETITASKVSGIEKPLLVTMNSQLLPFSFYDNYIRIGNKSYTNPLAQNPLHRYNFKCIDTTNNVYTILFNPKKSARFEGLKGTIFIDADSYAITKAVYYPWKEAKSLRLTLVASFRKNNNDLFLPYHVKTLANIENIGVKNLSFLASASSVYNSINLDTTFDKSSFDEYAIKFHSKDTIKRDKEFWKKKRKLPFSEKDSTTYVFYDSVGNVKNFEKLVYSGELLASKKVPYKFIDFNLRKLIRLNEFEGLRLGLGFETNEKLHPNLRFGTYFGYGLKDELTKYGGHISYLFLDKAESSFKVSYSNDVHESGSQSFYMDQYQYSSEWLRKLRIRVMERIRLYSFEYSFKPLRFLYLRFQLSQSENTIYDRYRFINDNKTTYNYLELKSSFHYQFGQKYLRLINDKHPFEQHFPHLWIEYSKGIQINNLGDFNYNKLEFKINYKHKFLNFGESGMEISGGWIDKSIPYYKLFNAKGSSEIRTVAHNSFETMGYNEFFSDHYLAMFYSHDFGYWNFFYNPNFRPRLEVAYNIGIGSLQERDNHQNIDYKSFNRLYMEAGFLINNILTINLTAIKMGFGMGIYHRFGPLANDTFVENTFFKVSTSFNL